MEDLSIGGTHGVRPLVECVVVRKVCGLLEVYRVQLYVRRSHQRVWYGLWDQCGIVLGVRDRLEQTAGGGVLVPCCQSVGRVGKCHACTDTVRCRRGGLGNKCGEAWVVCGVGGVGYVEQ